MPRAPSYGGPKVQTQALPDAYFRHQADSDPFAAVGQAMRGIGTQMQQYAEKEQAKADEARILEMDMQLANRQAELEARLAEARGRNALGMRDQLQADWDKFTGEIGGGLASDRQRQAFAKLTATRGSALFRAATFHESREMEAYNSELLDASASAHSEAAVRHAYDPQRRDLELGGLQVKLEEFAASHGKSPEWVQQELGKRLGATHYGIVSRMLANGDDLAAADYFKANHDQFGAHFDDAEKALEEGSLRGESQRRADQIVGATGDLGEATKRVREISDPKLRDATLDRVTKEFSLRKAADEARRDALFSRAGEIVETTADPRNIPPSEWLSLTASQRAALETRARQVREGIEPVTDWTSYYDLKQLAASPETRSQFAKVNLLEYRPKLADAEFKELAGIQSSLRSGSSKADSELNGYRTTKQIVDASLAAVGINPNAKADDEEEAARVALFQRRVDERVMAEQERLSRKLDNREKQAIVDNLLVEGTKPGSGFPLFIVGGPRVGTTQQRVFEAASGERLDIEVDAIPMDERAKIEQALSRRGLPISDAAVIELYQAKLQKDAR